MDQQIYKRKFVEWFAECLREAFRQFGNIPMEDQESWKLLVWKLDDLAGYDKLLGYEVMVTDVYIDHPLLIIPSEQEQHYKFLRELEEIILVSPFEPREE